MTAPAGWTPIYTGTTTAVYQAAGDVASTAFTRGPSGTKHISVAIAAFSGRSGAVVSSFQNHVPTGGGFPYIEATPVTSLLGDDVFFAYAPQFTLAGSAPAGYTDVASIAAIAYLGVSVASNVAAGSTGALRHDVTSGYGTDSVVVLSLAAASTGPTVTSASSNSNTEGSAIVHTITLSAATTGTTNFAATLVGVTATGGGTDFTSALASLTFSAGVTVSGSNLVVPSGVSSFTVSIPTTGDVLNEANETYTLTVGGVSGTGTITDNDAVPSVAVGDATQVGGTVTHTITLSAASGRTVTVDYATANSTKVAGVDYTAATGTLTFAPGETSKTVVVTVL